MINRVLIRLKVVQVMYAYYQNGERNLSSAERELSESVNSAYSLYHTLLYLLVALRRYSQKQITRKQKMDIRVPRKELLFAENRLMSQLENNESLISYIGTDDMSWLTDFVKGLYDQIMDSEELEEYYQEDVFDYESDKYLCRKLYRKFIENNEQLDDVLEQANIYWNGDKNLIDSFVQKTLKTFEEKNGAEQPLLRAFKDEDSREFAMNLLRSSIDKEESIRSVVSRHCNRWDPSRLAFMDVLIIQAAVAEMLAFPAIPLKVTINEYVEMSKYLSTPGSAGFVNGMLDTISKELIGNGDLNK
ncbi:MAG: transcription antitermination factor NusB [Bacteroidaceae bacterium]|nr:transcription antitermination factor NusB [Bacteroidaceae bacterium]